MGSTSTPAVLVRHVVGDQLRRRRTAARRTLREVSRDARVSLGYLSEVERGRKEASSELLGAICGALRLPVSQLLRDVSDDLALRELIADEARLITIPVPPLEGSGGPVVDLAA